MARAVRFSKSAGMGFLAFGLPPTFLVRAAGAEQEGRGKVLVVVFQRGGMDGLNVVIPFKDRAYYALRPSIAVAEPASGEQRAIDLDGFYASASCARGAKKHLRQETIGDHSRRRLAGQQPLAFRFAGLHGARHAGHQKHAGWLAQSMSR